jgi:hypothetical protein
MSRGTLPLTPSPPITRAKCTGLCEGSGAESAQFSLSGARDTTPLDLKKDPMTASCESRLDRTLCSDDDLKNAKNGFLPVRNAVHRTLCSDDDLKNARDGFLPVRNAVHRTLCSDDDLKEDPR